MYKKNGTPISSTMIDAKTSGVNTLSPSEIAKLRKVANLALGVHIATVRDVYYTDSQNNVSKKYVEYKIRIESGPRLGTEYYNVIAMNIYGGTSNFSEEVYQPIEKTKDNQELSNSTLKDQHDGSEVLVIFLDNEFNKPIIIGGSPSTTQSYPGAKIADGQRSAKEFNGIRTLINKDGEFFIIYYGGKRNSNTKKTARADTAPTVFRILKDGTWAIEDKENQKIEINRTLKKIILEQRANKKAEETYAQAQAFAEEELINSIEMDKDKKSITTKVGKDTIVEMMDGINEIITVVFKSGMKITEDGKNNKMTIDCGATKVEIDGPSKNITLTAGSAIIKINGASGKIELTGKLVDVGAAASAAAVLGPQLLAYLKAHTHKYAPGPGAPTETAPPTVPPPASLLSKTVKIKE